MVFASSTFLVVFSVMVQCGRLSWLPIIFLAQHMLIALYNGTKMIIIYDTIEHLFPNTNLLVVARKVLRTVKLLARDVS